MGADYSLEVSTEMKPANILSLMAQEFGFDRDGEHPLSGPAIWISAVETRPIRRQIIEEAFRFTPDLSVGLRVDPTSADYEEGLRAMLRATMLLLSHGRDAVLLFNGEHIVLQRLEGQLVLNTDYGGWTDGFCLEGEIHLPHEKHSLPSPLL